MENATLSEIRELARAVRDHLDAFDAAAARIPNLKRDDAIIRASGVARGHASLAAANGERLAQLLYRVGPTFIGREADRTVFAAIDAATSSTS